MTKVFNIPQAIQAAWDVLWADNLKRRAEDSAFRVSETYYLCAADVENQVRAFAEDTFYGRPWRKDRQYGAYPTGIRFKGDLKRTVRDWLFARVSTGILAVHNFGRGHISGARFRPAGEPISPAEQGTLKKKLDQKLNPKPKLKHYSKHGFSGRPACTASRRRSPFSRSNHRIWTTKDQKEVTCPRCAKLLSVETGA